MNGMCEVCKVCVSMRVMFVGVHGVCEVCRGWVVSVFMV